MPSTIIDDAGRLRQRWAQFVTDVTPSQLPSGFFAKQSTSSTVGQLDVGLQLPLIHACCQQCDVSPLSLVQAAWAAVLRSYSGSDDVMFAGIGLEPRTSKKQWTNTSIFRARLEAETALIAAISEMREEGLLEADALVSVPEALQVFSTLEPKPCNSAIWLRDPTSKSELSQTDIVNNKTVSPIHFYRRIPSLTTPYLVRLCTTN